MLIETIPDRVYLASGSTDMRKSIDTLAVLVKEGLLLDPFSSSLFVFCSKDRTRLKFKRPLDMWVQVPLAASSNIKGFEPFFFCVYAA